MAVEDLIADFQSASTEGAQPAPTPTQKPTEPGGVPASTGNSVTDDFTSFSNEEDTKRSFSSLTPAQKARMLATVQYPSEEGIVDSFLAGANQQMVEFGTGLTNRALDVYEFFGGETGDLRERLEVSADIEAQKIKGTQEENPIATGAGQVAGAIASFPVAPAGKLAATGAGAAYGFLQRSDSTEETVKNVVADAALGGLGAAAAPYIQKGFNKGQALFSSLYKRFTGADPRPNMFTPDGQVSEVGRKTMEDLGIGEEEFARIYQTVDEKLNPIQATRQARAAEQGIPLTQGQVTKDFATQEAEETLKASVAKEGTAARQFEEGQQTAIQQAQEGFERQLGPDLTREQRGEVVQQALRGEQKAGRENVRELYDQAAKTSGLGVEIEKTPLLDTIDDLIDTRPIEEKNVKLLEKAMAKFGLIEGEVKQAGRFNQVIDSDGAAIKFRGEQTPLNLNNAEEFRQRLNQILPDDQSGAVSQVIKQLDTMVDDSINKLSGQGKAEAFQTARTAAREQKQIFAQKDIIQNIVDYKKGTRTDTLAPDRVIDSVLKGANVKANLKRVKSVLTTSANKKTNDAWKAVQAQGAADLFSQSIDPVKGGISGARLKTAIKRFGGGSEKEGRERLKILLGDKYGEFDNLVEAIGDATIPVKGVSNPSGTAYKALNFMIRAGNVGEGVAILGARAKAAAKSRSVLRQIEKAEPEKVKQAVKANDDLIDAFVRLGVTGSLRELED
ncbi:hypothetical protein PODOV084v1_p0046 [Vibrio phage 340E47.2]|nr:hypothetical protein PODOV084v1_p0046 [Vibrio phage 340E47.2]QZI91952.1 hypothetical protein PODOV077v1_p0041 [Vibrio phage 5P1a]